MASFQETRLQRAYVQLESLWGTVPNSGGAATVANGNAFGFASLSMGQDQPELNNPVKTGNLGMIDGTLGRKGPLAFSVDAPLIGSGSAGTAPNMGPFYQAALGKAPVTVAATSVTYGADDTNYSVAVFDFVQPSTLEQRCASGLVINSMEIGAGGDWATVRFSGLGKSLIESDFFSSLDSVGKSGLSAFPSEPASPTFAYSPILGHKGVITLDGVAYTTVVGESIRINLTSGRALISNGWNSDYPAGVTSGARSVGISFSIYDQDDANTIALKNKGRASTAVTCSFQLGTVAGNILTVTARLKLGRPTFGEANNLRTLSFNTMGRMSTLTAKDDISLAWT